MQDIHQMGGGSGSGTGGAGRFFGGGDRRMRLVHHHHQALKCPRCDSLNTKFCYYNNYNLSQPRHFCKTCRRYWTKGGVLRNVPVGGGCRKAKRSTSKHSSPAGKLPLAGDDGEDKSAASHSSSESSSAAAATAVAAEVASVPVSATQSGSFNNNPKQYHGNGIEWSAFLGQGSSDDGIFAEIGSLTSFVATSSNETMPFLFGGTSINEQCLDQDLKVEGETVGRLLDDQTVQMEFPARPFDQNVGFGPLDWGGPGGDQAFFDLTGTADHTYWSQSQSQWTTDHQDHGGLHLP